MGLRIEHECDWCERREAVALPRRGPLDLGEVALPKGWDERPSFPGGQVGPSDGQQLCSVCYEQYDGVLEQAHQARDNVFRQAVQRAKNSRLSSQGRGNKGKTLSSSFR